MLSGAVVEVEVEVVVFEERLPVSMGLSDSRCLGLTVSD